MSKPLRSPILATCYFCSQPWGECRCSWNEDDGFDTGQFWITHPNVSECTRFFVDPNLHYGKAYQDWITESHDDTLRRLEKQRLER